MQKRRELDRREQKHLQGRQKLRLRLIPRLRQGKNQSLLNQDGHRLHFIQKNILDQ